MLNFDVSCKCFLFCLLLQCFDSSKIKKKLMHFVISLLFSDVCNMILIEISHYFLYEMFFILFNIKITCLIEWKKHIFKDKNYTLNILEESRSRENFPSDSSGQYWCHVLPCKLPLLVCVSSIYAFFFFFGKC